MSEEKEGATAPKKNSLPWSEVDALTAGIDRYEKTSFWVIGHRNGTRLALPKTATGVSRAYFYGTYEQVPAVLGIKTYTPEERKQFHKGGIIAEVDFEQGLTEATAALTALVEAVRAAPAPAPKGEKKLRAPKKPKEPVVHEAEPSAEAEPAPPAEPVDAGQ